MNSVIQRYFPEYKGVDFDAYDFENCFTRQDRMGPYSPMDVVAAILRTSGVITEMALLLNRSRNGVRNYIHSNREIYEVLDDVRESAIDRVEKGLFELAEGGDGASQRFIMQTLGKDRGYTTRVEQTGKGGTPLNGDQIDLSKLTEEELAAFVELRRKATPERS